MENYHIGHIGALICFIFIAIVLGAGLPFLIRHLSFCLMQFISNWVRIIRITGCNRLGLLLAIHLQ